MPVGSLLKPTGLNPASGGGLGSKIYLVPKEYLSKQPERDAANQAVISAALAFVTGKSAIEIYCTKETIEPTSKKIQGDNADCGGVENTMKVFHPTVTEDVLNFVAENGFGLEGYVFFKNSKDDKIYCLGEADYCADISDFEMKFGKTMSNATGVDLTFTAKQPLPLAIYTGGGLFSQTSIVTP